MFLDTKKQLVLLNIIFSVIIAFLPILGYFISGIEFAKGTLLGVFMVALNFFGIQRIFGKVIKEKRPIYFVSYIFKFLISIILLFVAVSVFQMDSWGIAFGLSSLFFAICVFVLAIGIF